METFGARPEDATQACLAEVEASDLFVGIYAHRYGFIAPKSEVSITEAEFDHAFKKRRPTFCYVVDDAYPWPEEFIEREPGRSLLMKFKAKLDQLVVRDEFTTPEALASRVAASIGRYLIADPRRHGAHNAAQFARLTLADISAAVFVDVMRLACVAGSDAARTANQQRYGEFVDIADEHFSDFKAQVNRLSTDADFDTISKSSDVERGLAWAIVRLRRGPTLDRSWSGMVTKLLDLAERINALADTVSRTYYEERIQEVAKVVDKTLRPGSAADLAHSADEFVRIRFAAQSSVISQMKQSGKFALATVRDDIDRRLAIPYFVIDLQLLRRTTLKQL
jgi:hypothetical protein